MYILFAYIIVAGAGTGSYKEWRAMAEFNTPVACQEAADKLKLPVFMCLRKGG